MKSINEQLIDLQAAWEKECYRKLKAEYGKDEAAKGKLSCAFSFGVSSHYERAEKKIMIVGQEANRHSVDYEKWGLENWQKWAVAYLNYQLYNEIDYSLYEKGNDYDFKYNKSPFWQFFRRLKRRGYGVCWNNLDKVRRYERVDGNAWKERKLPYDSQNRDPALSEQKTTIKRGR